MIKIDGISFNAEWQSKSFEQVADILNGDNVGRLQNTGDMYLDPIGTFYNTNGTIIRSQKCTDAEWDKLFKILSNPLSEHTVEIPFDQGYLTTKVYISQVKRTLIDQKFNRNKWSASYSVTFTAMESQWPAGGELQGYTVGV